jgi:putative DNA primase/helicase
MRRRLHLLPLTYVPAKPDPDLAETLREEWGGILAWAIRGSLMWQKDRLIPPPVVADAVAEYFADQDSIAAWLAERCERIPNATAKSRHLFADWALWAKGRGEEPGGEKRFSEALQRYAAKKRTNAGMVFLGLQLLPAEPPMDGYA